MNAAKDVMTLLKKVNIERENQSIFWRYSFWYCLGDLATIFLNTLLKLTALLKPVSYATEEILSKLPAVIFLQASLMRISFKKTI